MDKSRKAKLEKLFAEANHAIEQMPMTWIKRAQYVEHIKVFQILDKLKNALDPFPTQTKIRFYKTLHDIDFKHSTSKGLKNKEKIKETVWLKIRELEIEMQNDISNSVKPKANKQSEALSIKDLMDENTLELLTGFLKSENLLDNSNKALKKVNAVKRRFAIICHVLRTLTIIPEYNKTKSTQTICNFYSLRIGETTARENYTGDKLEKIYSKRLKTYFSNCGKI